MFLCDETNNVCVKIECPALDEAKKMLCKHGVSILVEGEGFLILNKVDVEFLWCAKNHTSVNGQFDNLIL